MSNVTLYPGGTNLPPTPNTLSPTAAVAIALGAPVARSKTLAGAVQLCSAHSGAGKIALCSGLAIRAAGAGDRVLIQYAGTVELTTAQWDAVTGGSGGLTEGDAYYVSDTDGMLTSTAPGGLDSVTVVGIAQSPTLLLLQIAFPVAG
jgi:hypothetical protein